MKLDDEQHLPLLRSEAATGQVYRGYSGKDSKRIGTVLNILLQSAYSSKLFGNGLRFLELCMRNALPVLLCTYVLSRAQNRPVSTKAVIGP